MFSYGPTWNINVTRKLNLRIGFSGFSNICDNGPFIPWTEFFSGLPGIFLGLLFLFFMLLFAAHVDLLIFWAIYGWECPSFSKASIIPFSWSVRELPRPTIYFKFLLLFFT